jgi:hypothetical protein
MLCLSSPNGLSAGTPVTPEREFRVD